MACIAQYIVSLVLLLGVFCILLRGFLGKYLLHVINILLIEIILQFLNYLTWNLTKAEFLWACISVKRCLCTPLKFAIF